MEPEDFGQLLHRCPNNRSQLWHEAFEKRCGPHVFPFVALGFFFYLHDHYRPSLPQSASRVCPDRLSPTGQFQILALQGDIQGFLADYQDDGASQAFEGFSAGEHVEPCPRDLPDCLSSALRKAGFYLSLALHPNRRAIRVFRFDGKMDLNPVMLPLLIKEQCMENHAW